MSLTELKGTPKAATLTINKAVSTEYIKAVTQVRSAAPKSLISRVATKQAVPAVPSILTNPIDAFGNLLTNKKGLVAAGAAALLPVAIKETPAYDIATPIVDPVFKPLSQFIEDTVAKLPGASEPVVPGLPSLPSLPDIKLPAFPDLGLPSLGKFFDDLKVGGGLILLGIGGLIALFIVTRGKR